ncbi:MAG: RadC family protein [Chitinispirillaceae bacterium]
MCAKPVVPGSESPDAPELTREGHRSRLHERYDKRGLEALHDHEILELILTYAIPRRDTKDIARKLLSRYGTISSVVNTPVEELSSIKGLGKRSASLFTLIRDTMAFCLNETCTQKHVISHRKDVEEYLRLTFGYRREEYVAVVFLDSANHVIKTEILSEGTVNQCVIYPRVVVEKALKCGAASFILAHNHPAGGMNPSEADWQITERLCAVGKLLEIPLLDHIIVSRQNAVSLRECSRWPRV